MIKPHLLVERFAVSRNDVFVYDQAFHKGVNIIRGWNGTGKSTVVDLLSYALGSVITDWTEHQSYCDNVYAQVLLNGIRVTLKRDIIENGLSKMYIHEGTIDTAVKLGSQWTGYPYRRSDTLHSFSQQLFELLSLPRHKTDDDRNLTLHQIMRLMYVDQLSATTKLLKEEKAFDNPNLRRAIGEYLLGIDDLEAHNLRQELLSETKLFEKYNSEANSIFKIIGGDDVKISEHSLNERINNYSKELDALNEKMEKLLSSENSNLNKEEQSILSKLQSKNLELVALKTKLEEDSLSLSREINDTKLFLVSLESRKDALLNSKAVNSTVGSIEFKYCPSCLGHIEVSNDIECCGLCKNTYSKNSSNDAYVKQLNNLNFQIKESSQVIVSLESELAKLKTSLENTNLRISETIRSLRTFSVIPSEKESMIIEIGKSIGFIESAIISLEENRGGIAKINALLLEKQRAQKRILDIREKLSALDESQAERHFSVYSDIEKITKRLLISDDGNEPAFDNPGDVIIDFARDKMYLDGMSKFSASSMVIFKNSIRLAIFLHCVDDKESRFPNFMIMDNIEDKGMVDARSHNFQHIIINECQNLRDEYQLIFTTSMISPDLNNTDLCVGPYYPKGDHTLKF
ncbi:AAA family ATPase [Citrobacter sp. FDAARGOS_156]|uniref:ATP-binding protein n=1 Tax=unclassified Citrobacter TaxID=2644389 RepID=UPI0019028B82|nr:MULTISPECIES: ATP-binding protein [unclassified Citrobacter]MBJ8888344.1 AAA family ATPase [Citrobacter sp. FDAARGOS_156]MDM2925962.1 AAA family ATPase [Citrobacter sp. Cpa228]